MLEIRRIRDEREAMAKALEKRHMFEDPLAVLDAVIARDDYRRAIQTNLDGLLARRNQLSKEIGDLYKRGASAEAETMKQQVTSMADEIRQLEEEQRKVVQQVAEELYNIPNVPHSLVPSGKGEEDNEVYQDWPEALPVMASTALPHWELAEKFGILDMGLGAKLTGSGFPVYRGKGAALQRALATFFLDEAIAAGYEEIIPPLMVNEASARATGQLPDKEGQMYHIGLDNFYMIPTAEVPVTNIYRDSVLRAEDFPIKLTGFTPCFRREAGSYGAEVKGLNRVHQFEKVEIVQLQHPDHSMASLDEMLKHVEVLLQKLELPYRILRLCGGDLGFAASITYDFEVYSAAQKRWLEVSSVSNFMTFQSHRMNLKYRDEDGKLQLAHTLNGSALALARIYAAILENFQDEDGIRIPGVLQKYTRFEKIQ